MSHRSPDYTTKLSAMYPDIQTFKQRVEEKIRGREERRVSREMMRDFRGEAAVLLALCYDAEGEGSIVDQVHILLQKRSNKMRHNPGDMAFPGGSVDKEDEDLFGTAAREAEEEMGIDPRNLDFIGFMDEFVSSSMKVVRVALAWLEEKETGNLVEFLKRKYAPRTEEAEAVVAIPLRHFLDPRNYYSTPYNSSGRRGFIRYFDIDPYLPNTQIWGLTASIIRRFLDIIFPENALPRED